MGNGSFILYDSLAVQTESMTDSQLGKLLRCIFAYRKTGEVPDPNDDPMVWAIFGFVRSHLDENEEKYRQTCQKNRENVQKRWRKQEQESSCTTVYDRNQSLPPNTNDTKLTKLTDSDSDSVSVSDVDSVSDSVSVLDNRPAGPGQPSRPIYDNDYVNVYDKGGHMVREEEPVDDFYPNHPYDLMPYT